MPTSPGAVVKGSGDTPSPLLDEDRWAAQSPASCVQAGIRWPNDVVTGAVRRDLSRAERRTIATPTPQRDTLSPGPDVRLCPRVSALHACRELSRLGSARIPVIALSYLGRRDRTSLLQRRDPRACVAHDLHPSFGAAGCSPSVSWPVLSEALMTRGCVLHVSLQWDPRLSVLASPGVTRGDRARSYRHMAPSVVLAPDGRPLCRV